MIYPGPSPLNSQTTESAPTQYHHPVESASPGSSGKMMPSGGKGGKPASMSGLMRTNMPSQPPSVQHPAYYNGGKGNPAAGGYPMMMSHPQQQSQQWMSQQQHRYATHLSGGGKPMAYAQQQQQRMPYGGDPYMMRQQTPQMPSSSYPYTSNIGQSSTLELVVRERNSFSFRSSTWIFPSSSDGSQCLGCSTSW